MPRKLTPALSLTAIALLVIVVAALSAPNPPTVEAGGGGAPVLQPPFDQDYTLTNLGLIPGDNADGLGPLVFAPGDPNTLIHGVLNESDDEGYLRTVGVQRDGNGHITGFSGDPEFYANANHNDGGADFAPNGVLFVTTYGFSDDGNLMLQYKPGSTDPDKTTDLASIGIEPSVGALRFVPAGFPGAGLLKVDSTIGADWFTVPFTENSEGTYDLGTAVLHAEFNGLSEPESPVYVGIGPEFDKLSVLVAEYGANQVAAYEIDANGDPIISTQRIFASGDSFDPAGMVQDPVTGDLIIGDYSSLEVFVVSGFGFHAVKGDLNCNGSVDGLDVIASLRYASSAETDGLPGCPEIGGFYPGTAAAGFDNLVGDINCNNIVDEEDTLLLLKYLGDLPPGINIPTGCKEIGS